MHRDDEVDERFMRRAIELAYAQLGNASPNPAVGCVVVKDGEIVGEGATRPSGGNHAEIEALTQAEEKARGATLYTTLEPCSHENKRTPPCTHAIVDAGIARVVIGTIDPNPEVNGKGAAVLKSAGIAVDVGILADATQQCHEFFMKWIATGSPFVSLKIAMTIDGKSTWGDGKNKKITGGEAKGRVHLWRAQHDAIMVGVETVLADDPQLTTRLCEGSQPVRVILDSRLRMPPSARLLKEPGKTIIFTTPEHDAQMYEELSTICDVVVVDSREGRCDLSEVIAVLGELSITSVLIEAGPRLAAAVIEQGITDKALFFFAPFSRPDGVAALGALTQQFSLARTHVECVGDDVLITGYF